MKTILLVTSLAFSLTAGAYAQASINRMIDPADPRGPIPSQRNRGSNLSSTGGTRIGNSTLRQEVPTRPQRATEAEVQKSRSDQEILSLNRQRVALLDKKQKAAAANKPTARIDQDIKAIDQRIMAVTPR